MDASTQVAPMPVLHSVMMLKVSEASRATSVTRAAAAAAAAAATSRRNSLSLQHALLQVTAESVAALSSIPPAAPAAVPMTPLASDLSVAASAATKVAVAPTSSSSSPAATACSPRDPSSKVAATSPPLFAAKHPGYAVSPLKLHPTIQTHAAPLSPNASSSESAPSSPEPSPVGKRTQTASGTPKSSSSVSSPKACSKANTGRWTDAEHQLFLQGLETFPYRAWKKIATLIKTRTVVQIRTHAQKYYQKLEKEEARMKDREHQAPHQHGFKDKDASSSAAAAAASHHLPDASEYSDASVSTPRAGSPAKKKSLLRKRKFTMDEDSPALSISAAAANGDASAMAALPSLPKRMMKEKKFPREKHMSPKQKAPVSGNKFFGASFSSPESSGSESAHRAVFARGGAGKIPPHPLDFADDTASEGMILDFADDKSIAEYPFHLDGSMDQSISSMDNDDLLQLTDEECLDWFSTASSDEEWLVKSESTEVAAAAAATASAPETSTPALAVAPMESSPLTLGRYHFSPLYTDECVQFADDAGYTSPSATALLEETEDFTLGEDDDFVLDPEKFLSSYFNPSSEN